MARFIYSFSQFIIGLSVCWPLVDTSKDLPISVCASRCCPENTPNIKFCCGIYLFWCVLNSLDRRVDWHGHLLCPTTLYSAFKQHLMLRTICEKFVPINDTLVFRLQREYNFNSEPQRVGPSGGGLGLKVCSLQGSRFKVQYLMGANNLLGPHLLVKSQRFNQFRVGKLPRV